MTVATSPSIARLGSRSRQAILLALGVVLAASAAAYTIVQRRRAVEWSGTIEARTISVGSRVGGRVKEVLVKEGDRVAEKQPLVVLEEGELEAQRMIAEGELEQARATLEKLESGARPEEIDQAKARAATAQAAYSEARAGARKEQIQGAAARLAAAQAAADNAQAAAERARSLFASQAVSQAHLDRAESSAKAAVGERDALRQRLEELENGARREELVQAEGRAAEAAASARLVVAGSRVEDLRGARALVRAAEGRLKRVQVSIEELTIRAPRAARVESLKLRPGDMLNGGVTAASLLEDGQLYARIYVPETQLGSARVGSEVRLRVDSFEGRTFLAVIEHVDAVGEYTPRNLHSTEERADHVFGTRVGLREGTDVLRAGMSAWISVPR